MKYKFYCNCVCWNSKDIDGLSEMIDNSIDITRKTFLKHVDREQLYNFESQLGYERFARRGLTMADDYTVSYHRSTLHGKTVYYFRQSAIEYVFVGEDYE